MFTCAKNTANGLDALLHKSREQLAQISRGEFEQAGESLKLARKEIQDYLENPASRSLSREQTQQLRQIYTCQRQAAELVSDLKQELAKKITELRQGRNLRQTYKLPPSSFG